jgi:hypothetical protein
MTSGTVPPLSVIRVEITSQACRSATNGVKPTSGHVSSTKCGKSAIITARRNKPARNE